MASFSCLLASEPVRNPITLSIISCFMKPPATVAGEKYSRLKYIESNKTNHSVYNVFKIRCPFIMGTPAMLGHFSCVFLCPYVIRTIVVKKSDINYRSKTHHYQTIIFIHVKHPLHQ